MEAIKPEIDHRKTDVGIKQIGLTARSRRGWHWNERRSGQMLRENLDSKT